MRASGNALGGRRDPEGASRAEFRHQGCGLTISIMILSYHVAILTRQHEIGKMGRLNPTRRRGSKAAAEAVGPLTSRYRENNRCLITY
jgi:hypothetical protein